MNSSNYQQSVETMREHLEEFFALIQRHSTPLYSPRYNQHMGGESSLPAILGYLSVSFQLKCSIHSGLIRPILSDLFVQS